MVQIKNPVTIVQGGQPTPASPVTKKDINFYDYDGTLVDSWTLTELAGKTALPANPTHSGLTAQGWNWTLAQLQAENSKADVGQMYTTTDGKTHLFVEVDADHLEPNLAIGLNGTAIVDWGDGTSTTTLTGSSVDVGQNSYHTYSSAGNYEVTIEIPEGSAAKIRGNTSYVCFLWKGEATQTIQGGSAKNLAYAAQLKHLRIGDRMEIVTFYLMKGLVDVTIPSSVTTIGSSTFNNCVALQYVTLPSVATLSSSTFYQCRSLKAVALPPSITSVSSSAFEGCCSLESIVLPSSVTSVATSAFYGCLALKDVTLLATTSLGDSSFYGCESLMSIVIPASVTLINNYAFSQSGVCVVDCSTATSVPTAGASIFGTIAVPKMEEGFIIKVPSALEATWKTTTGWDTYASYIVGV